MDWKELLTSPAAITFYISLTLFIYRKLQISHKWDTERWEGIIAAAFNIAENSKILSSNAKLELALQEFGKQYQATHNKPASPMDMRDAALDFAKLAMAMKFAPAPTAKEAA